MELIEQIIISYSYIGIIVILTGGIIGLPIPDEVILTFIGYYIYKEKLVYTLAFLSAFIGSTAGITISYILGSRLGLPFLEKYGPRLHISKKKIEKTQHLFSKYGSLLLLIGFFIPGIRHITGYLSGIAQYRFLKFAFFAYTGAFLWVIAFITLGQALGPRWFLIKSYVLQYSFYLFALFCIIILLLLIRYKLPPKKR